MPNLILHNCTAESSHHAGHLGYMLVQLLRYRNCIRNHGDDADDRFLSVERNVCIINQETENNPVHTRTGAVVYM